MTDVVAILSARVDAMAARLETLTSRVDDQIAELRSIGRELSQTPTP